MFSTIAELGMKGYSCTYIYNIIMPIVATYKMDIPIAGLCIRHAMDS